MPPFTRDSSTPYTCAWALRISMLARSNTSSPRTRVNAGQDESTAGAAPLAGTPGA